METELCLVPFLNVKTESLNIVIRQGVQCRDCEEVVGWEVDVPCRGESGSEPALWLLSQPTASAGVTAEVCFLREMGISCCFYC